MKKVKINLDKPEMQSRIYVPQVRVLNPENRIVRYTTSTRGIDGHGTRVMDWDFSRYMKNPVVLWSHSHAIPPVGRALSVEDDGVNVISDIQFAPAEVYDFAGVLYRLTEADYLRGVSASFRPKEAKRNKELDCIDLYGNELGEQSIVSVPSNADSLAAAARSGMIPDSYMDLFVLNKTIGGISGVEDLEALREQVRQWAEASSWGRDIPYEVKGEKGEEPADDEASASDAATLEARVNELSAIADELQRGLEAEKARNDELQRHNDELLQDLPDVGQHYVAALRTIAGIVEYDVKSEYDADDVTAIAAAVQESVVRAGAMLSKKSREALKQCVSVLEKLLTDAGDTEYADEDEGEEKSGEKVAGVLRGVEEKLAELQARMDAKPERESAAKIIQEEQRSASRKQFLDDLLGKLNKTVDSLDATSEQ